MGLSELPEAAVIIILQHVPLKQRLSLALVSRAWAAAAVLSAVDVDVALRSKNQMQKFQHWLERCAGQGRLGCLTAQYQQQYSYDTRCFLQVPCSALTQLVKPSLRHVQVVLGMPHAAAQGSRRTRSSTSTAQSRALTSSSRPRHTSSSGALADASSPAAAGFLPQLQQLELINCDITEDSFRQLSQLSRLTSLTLEKPRLYRTAYHMIKQSQQGCFDGQAVATMLTQLPDLSVLSLGSPLVSAQALTAISGMQNLQSLKLDAYFASAAGISRVFEQMPVTLPALRLQRVTCTSSTAAQLSNLVELQLRDAGVRASLLRSFPKLQLLALQAVSLLPEAPHADQHPQEAVGALQHIGNLLAAIAQLTQLRRLELAGKAEAGGCGLGMMPASSLSSLTALTASSYLTALGISGLGCRALPEQAVLHMLPFGKQLRQLRALHVAAIVPSIVALAVVQRCLVGGSLSTG